MIDYRIMRCVAILAAVIIFSGQAAYADYVPRQETHDRAQVQNVVFFIPIIAAIKVAVISAVKAIAVKVPIIAKAATLAAKIGPKIAKVAKVTKKVVKVAQKTHDAVDKLKKHQIASPAAAQALRAMSAGVMFASAVAATGADPAAIKQLQEDEKEVRADAAELDNDAKEQGREEMELVDGAGKCAGVDPYSGKVTNEKPTDADCDFPEIAYAPTKASPFLQSVLFAVDEGNPEDKHWTNDELEKIDADLDELLKEENLAAEAEEALEADILATAKHKEENASEETIQADANKVGEDAERAMMHDKKAYDAYIKAHKDGLPSAPGSAPAVKEASLRI